ncbi:MAG: nucleotidyltransferase family protein [Chlorobi bacterium]|nr:nucleotidyltransferase family protein [Chlorobiota bacterium]
MKAFLLAAGVGTRLRPLTDSMPKCLVKVCGKPMLQWWLELLEFHGVSEVLINTHHFPDLVESFLASYSTKMDIHTTFEPKLLGSAGTLRANRAFISDGEPFYICYADNLTNINLAEMMATHTGSRAVLTMALKEMDNPSTRGIAMLDESGRVVSFEEKPAQPKSRLANAGVYIASTELLERITGKMTDIGYDLIPRLVGDIQGYRMHEYLRDIGTVSSLEAAEREWPKILHAVNWNGKEI